MTTKQGLNKNNETTKKLHINTFKNIEITKAVSVSDICEVYEIILNKKKFALKKILLSKAKSLNKTNNILIEKHCLIKLNTPCYLDSTKFVYPLEKNPERAVNVINYAECASSHICKIIHTQRDSNYAYMILEYCDGNELFNYIKGFGLFNMDTIIKILIQLINGFMYVHNKHICHRDIKAENIGVKTTTINNNTYYMLKIFDFGSSRDFQLNDDTIPFIASKNHRNINKLIHSTGSPNFMPIEMIKNMYSDYSSDIYQFGCLCYQLLVGLPPFMSSNDLVTYIRAINLDLDVPCFVPEVLLNTWKQVIKLGSNERPSWDVLVKILGIEDKLKLCCTPNFLIHTKELNLFDYHYTIYIRSDFYINLLATHLNKLVNNNIDKVFDDLCNCKSCGLDKFYIYNAKSTDISKDCKFYDSSYLLQNYCKANTLFLLVPGFNFSMNKKIVLIAQKFFFNPRAESWKEVWNRLHDAFIENKNSIEVVDAVNNIISAKAIEEVVKVPDNYIVESTLLQYYIKYAFNSVIIYTKQYRHDGYEEKLVKQWLATT